MAKNSFPLESAEEQNESSKAASRPTAKASDASREGFTGGRSADVSRDVPTDVPRRENRTGDGLASQADSQADSQAESQADGLAESQEENQADSMTERQADVLAESQEESLEDNQAETLEETRRILASTWDEARLGKVEKPFRLAKYFSLAAVVSTFAACLFLAVMMSDRAEKIIYDRVVDETVMLMDNLNYQMFNSFLLPIYRSRGEARLSLEEPYRFLDAVIQGTVHGFDISKVSLYDARFGMMVYSSDSTRPVVVYEMSPETGEMIPKGKLAEPMNLYQEAIRVSRLPNAVGRVTRESVASWPQQSPGSPDRAAYINNLKERTVIVKQEGGYLFGSFFPRGRFTIRCLKAMEDYYTHNISGVLELTRDLSAEYRQIADMQYRALIVAVVTAMFLSFVLWGVVFRGESIINQKNAEKLALDERLHRAERLANLGQMVATVSHEIRNPLGIIRSSADFLASSLKENPGQKRLAGAIVDESERLWRILTDFLDFARPMEPNLEAVVVEDILEEILVLLEADLSRAGVELVSKLRSDPGPILADPDQLHRAFMNLLVNAIQAMPDGGLLTVSTFVQSPNDPQGALIVAIQDTGPGLSKEAASHLFLPFHTTKTKGTGLGLVLVRNVVESHAGHMDLSNIEGGPEEHGLLVTVSLPLRAIESLDFPESLKAEAAETDSAEEDEEGEEVEIEPADYHDADESPEGDDPAGADDDSMDKV